MARVSELNGPFLGRDSENTVTKSTWRLERHRLAALCEGVALVDFQAMQVLEANSALAAILGRSLKKVIGHFPWEWDAHYLRDQILALPGLIERREIDFQVCHENVIRRPDGACVEVETSFSVSEQDGKQYLFMTCLDISAGKAAERALERQAKMYRQAMAGMNDGVILLKGPTSSTVCEYNEAFARMLGYDCRTKSRNPRPPDGSF